MPLFPIGTELDVPVVIHSANTVGFGEERLREYRLARGVGRPMDGALRHRPLIVRGVFEKVPDPQSWSVPISGGGICEEIGRMDYAYRLQDEAYSSGPIEPMLIKHPPATISR